jgi:hypothetical protein
VTVRAPPATNDDGDVDTHDLEVVQHLREPEVLLAAHPEPYSMMAGTRPRSQCANLLPDKEQRTVDTGPCIYAAERGSDSEATLARLTAG